MEVADDGEEVVVDEYELIEVGEVQEEVDRRQRGAHGRRRLDIVGIGIGREARSGVLLLWLESDLQLASIVCSVSLELRLIT